MLRETQILIAANGDLELAAETLGLDSNVLLAKIAADDLAGIRAAVTVANAMHTLHALSEVKVQLLAHLDDMSPAILAKLFVSLVEKTQEISLEQVANTNYIDGRSINIGDSVRNTLEDKISSLIHSNSSRNIDAEVYAE